MTLTNNVTLIGFCADKPTLKYTKKGQPMVVLVVYTHEYIDEDHYRSQPNRCLFFGKKAERIAEKANKGLHIHIRGTLRSQPVRHDKKIYYYTNILVEDFILSPKRNVDALKDAVKEIIERRNVTNCDQLGFLDQ